MLKPYFAYLPLLMLAPLCACAPASDPDPIIERNWKKLGDGSYFAKHDPDKDDENFGEQSGGIRFVELTRCWPDDGNFQCIKLTYDPNSNIGGVDATLQEFKNLNLVAERAQGYSCYVTSGEMFGIVYQETIYDEEGEELLSNMEMSRPPYTSGWGREFVEKFLSENNVVGGKKFFNCMGLRKLVDDGGPATLGTTAATRDQFLD